MRLQIRSTVACPRRRLRAMVVIDRSGEAMKGLPLFVSCPNPELPQFRRRVLIRVDSIMAERVIEPETNG